MKITKSIKFTKAKLESIKHTEKVQQFFDLSCVGLSLHVQPKPSLTKSYYASWGVKTIGPDGKQKTSGRRRYICRFNQKPLDVVKRLINIKLPEWKKLNETAGGQTIETLKLNILLLVSSFHTHIKKTDRAFPNEKGLFTSQSFHSPNLCPCFSVR